MKHKHPADYLTFVLVLWILLYLTANVVPQSWFLDYHFLHATDVCRDGQQVITGERTVPFKVEARGTDQLWSHDKVEFVDRLEWEGGYAGGTTQTAWRQTVHEPPGTYRWEATTLVVKLPLFIRVNISGVRSDDFNVYECE